MSNTTIPSNVGVLTIPTTKGATALSEARLAGKLVLVTPKTKTVITSVEQLKQLSASLDDVFASSSVDFPHEYTDDQEVIALARIIRGA